MPEQVTPEWRRAIKDGEHPLHDFAWSIFRYKAHIGRIAEQFADQEDEIISFLHTILDDEDLYFPEGMGEGAAPYNAIQLLGKWQVVDSIPKLLEVLMFTEEHFFEGLDGIFDTTIKSLNRNYGKAVVDPVLRASENDTLAPDLAASILAKQGQSDSRCYELVEQFFEDADPNDDDIETFAYAMSKIDQERATPVIKQRLKTVHDERLRRVFKSMLDDEEYSRA